jgi:sec-independent protein translocase protein TatB
MIDLGLTKIALIGAVALIVIGPEKLPAVARMAGTLFGRAQRYISNVKAEVNREMQMEELNKMHSNIVNAANNLHKTVADDIAEAEQDFTQAVAEANQSYLGGDGWKHAPSEQDLAEKSKHFRKKKLAHTSSLPMWFKRQSGLKSRVISGAARVARYRPSSKTINFFN